MTTPAPIGTSGRWQPNYRKGVDLPTWDWPAFFPGGPSYPGTGNASDGVRYIYWLVQFASSAAGTAGTTQLWRFDTWTEGWQFLVTTAAGGQGADLEYDPVRNVLYLVTGNGGTTFGVFNLNTAPVTVANTACPAFALTNIAIGAPVAVGAGSSLTLIEDVSIPATMDTAAVATGSTTTTLVQDTTFGTYRANGPGQVGSQVRFTTGALAGTTRLIVAAPDTRTLTVNALPAAPAVGDQFVIELPSAAVTAATATTLSTGQTMVVNQYANSDVVIVSGTGSPQRRRIASNDAAGVLTLAAALTAPATNPRVGPWATVPDTTSVFRIVPSSDYLYFQAGGAATLHRLDVAQTGAAPAWTAMTAAPGITGGGANTMAPQQYDPFSILCFRGAGTASIYRYGIGPNSWTTPAVFAAGETFTTGASAAMIHGRRRLFVQKEGSVRTYLLDLTTGVYEPGPFVPYANPSAVDGHRARFMRTADGVEWLYLLRAGGTEHFRVPLEWLV